MDTQNRRLIDGAVRIAGWVKWLIGVGLLAGFTWATLGARVTALEEKIDTKQSKEAADGTRDVILTRIEALLSRIEKIEQRMDEREERLEERRRAR